MMLTSIVFLVPNVQASKPAYNAPCKEGDWKSPLGLCCPKDTKHIAHNICLTEKEYQQRKQFNKDSSETTACITLIHERKHNWQSYLYYK